MDGPGHSDTLFDRGIASASEWKPLSDVESAGSRILGDIPIRNRNFTGRLELLDQLEVALRTGSTTSVLPPTLGGLGGVGKTQLVIEYVHRHLDQYDLVWWIPAEQTATVLTALTQLAERLGLPVAEDQQETARTVLNWLAGSDREWLLVYDNADDPSTLSQLLPSTGGHVIVTTRIEEWSRIGVAIEVDVFHRRESIELLTNRTGEPAGNPTITEAEADELADRLGDLPLALEQAAAWYLVTGMPIREYIDLLEDRIKDLLDEGKPADYPLTVAAFVAVAVEKLRAADEAAAQMFSLFAYLGGEPVRQSLLRHGSNADVAEPLRTALGDPIRTSRIVRDLRRYGLAKAVDRPASATSPMYADRSPRLQVHRLVQRVLRDTLAPDEQRLTLRNVQSLLTAANPGDPDDVGEFERQREMGPHLLPADMINSGTSMGRQVVLDHSRFLYLSGDYENSRTLADLASTAWAADTSDAELGPDGQQTLLARAQVANATRALGDSDAAAAILHEVYERFRANPRLGPTHVYTLITGNQVGHDMRIRGRYHDALAFDRESVTLHRQVFGEGGSYTLRAIGNLAVDHRLIGEFAEALKLDNDIAGHWADVGGLDVSVLRAYMNVAHDHYGLGNYRAALGVLEQWLPVQERLLGQRHGLVLMSERTHAVTLRKVGRLEQAVEVMRTNYERTANRFNPNHEFSVAAGMSLANALRQSGRLDEATAYMSDALSRYRSNFGPDHPLTLAAQVNDAIMRRAGGDETGARHIDRETYGLLRQVLGEDHPYTICAGTSLATSLAMAREHRAALELSREMLRLSRRADTGGAEARGGADHPYVLMRAINLSYDLLATGAEQESETLYQDSLERLRWALGGDHPEVGLAQERRRLEGDIEPPPT